MRLVGTLLLVTVNVIGCRRAFADRARCAQDLRDYEDRVRIEHDTIRQAQTIAAADSDAILAGRGAQQRMVIHNVLVSSARSRLPARGVRTGKVAQFVCADTAQ